MKSLFEEMGGTYRQEGDYLMLCEFLFFSLQSPHLCNMKQNGYQNAAFGCFGLMPLHSVFLPQRQQLPEFRRLFLQHRTSFDL